MTYDEIMDLVTPNYQHGKNVRVIEVATDEDGNRETAFTHYLNGWLATNSLGIQFIGNTWCAYDIDWDIRCPIRGQRNWHADTFATESDALAYVASMSDYALCH